MAEMADAVTGTKPKTVKKESSDDAARAAHAGLDTQQVQEVVQGAVAAQTLGEAVAGGRACDKTKTKTTETETDPRPNRYYFKDGLRRVEPYYYTYNTWVKERWRGRTMLAVFESEFRDRPLAYYRSAMEAGTVTVNQKTVGPDHVLQNGERISHTTHRHEPPVTADPVVVIHEDADMLVINKPAGVPVHPAGRYQYNSVVEILKAERDPSFIPYPCNRLDRLTSGIMFLAKSPAAAKRLSLQIQARAVRKEYLARVVGRFPDSEVVCDQPILQISPKLGLNRVRANGRSARTVFKRLAYYEKAEGSIAGRGYSIVRCLPVTGRTHQIRVHLQYLGHPIENDPIYANQKVWGLDLGCGDADASRHSDEDVISRLSRMGKEDVADAVAYYDEMVDEYHKRRAEKMSGHLCTVCRTPLYSDPGIHELSLWLHSLRYEDANGAWSYVSPLPTWALPPDGASGPTDVGVLDDLVGASDAQGAIAGEEEEAAAAKKPDVAKTPKAKKKKVDALAAKPENEMQTNVQTNVQTQMQTQMQADTKKEEGPEKTEKTEEQAQSSA